MGAGTIGFTYYDNEGSKFDQRVGQMTLGIPGLNLKYANDWMFGLPLGDNGDRYRTAALKLEVGAWEIGFNLFTGDPGLNDGDREHPINPDTGKEEYKKNILGNNPDEFRAGIGYIGFGPFRFGNDTEKRRDLIQNKIVHDKISHSPHFRVDLNRANKSYFQFGGGGSLW